MRQTVNTENKPNLKFRFDLKSFLLFLLIFVIEVIIACFVRDRLIRPYGGDILVVILMYYFVSSFIQTKPSNITLGVLGFAYLIEIGQYFNLVHLLGLHHNKVMCTLIGSCFSWGDMICYTIGAVICLLLNRKTTT